MEKSYSVGKLFKAVRLVQGFKQAEFSRQLGISQGYVSKIEQDLISPDIDLMIRLSNHFNISLDSFRLGFLPDIIEGPGMSKLLPLEYREGGQYRLLVIKNLLIELGKVSNRGKIDSLLCKLKIREMSFTMPNVKVNNKLLDQIFNHFRAEFFNQDLYHAVFNNEDIEAGVTASINDFVQSETIFKVDEYSDENLLVSIDTNKVQDDFPSKSLEHLKSFNLAYLNHRLGNNELVHIAVTSE